MEDTNKETKQRIKGDKETISLEPITRLERCFLNYARNFKEEEWLLDLLDENVEKTINDLIDSTIQDIALREIIEEQYTNNINEDNVNDIFEVKLQRYNHNEDFLKESIDFWSSKVEETINEELKLPKED